MKKGKNLYLLVSLCMMAASSIGLYLNSFGVFFSPMAEAVAMFNTIMIFANAVFSIIVPMVATNKNYKKFYLGGIIGSIAALILMANATGLLMLYAGGLLLGASASTYFLVVITTVINNSFECGHHGRHRVQLQRTGWSHFLTDVCLNNQCQRL